MADAQVPAPARTNTNPKKMRASAVDSVQGVRMWITRSLCPTQGKISKTSLRIYDSKAVLPDLWITRHGASCVASLAAS